MEANTSLCCGSDVRIAESPVQKKKKTRKKQNPASWIWKCFVCLSFRLFRFIFGGLFFCCISTMFFFFFFSSAQIIPFQLLRIFNNPFASLLSPHGDLIEFHNLSNIAPDENVLWPRWHIGLHLNGFRAADKFFFVRQLKQNNKKYFCLRFGSWMNVCLWKYSSFTTTFWFHFGIQMVPFGCSHF